MKRITRLGMAIMMAALLCSGVLLMGCSDIAPSSSKAESTAIPQTVDDSLLVTPGTLTVGLDYTDAPYAGQKNDEVIGIDADVAAALADAMGLKVAYVDISATGGANALSSGMCDIFLSFDKATSSKTTNTYIGTYIYDAPSLFAISADGSAVDVDMTDMAGKTIAVQSNSVSAVAVAQKYGSGVVSEQDNLVNVFGTLESGGTDYAASSGVVGKYLVKSTPYTDIVWCGALSDSPTEIGIGGSATSTELNDAVKTALDTIDGNGVLDLVLSKWIGSPLEFSSTSTASSAATTTTTSAPAATVSATTTDSTDTTDTTDTTDETGTDTGSTDTGNTDTTA